MIYYYDAMGFVVWLNSSKKSMRDIYADIFKMVKRNRASEHMLPKNFAESSRGELIQIARSIEKTKCTWCPDSTAANYTHALKKSGERFVKKKSTDATDDMIPIGHYIGTTPRFYHPSHNWFSSPEYLQSDVVWKENNIIVGFDHLSAGGLHIRFRLRNPRQKIKHQKDARLAERGIICTSHSKPFLRELGKKLGIKNMPEKANITTLCNEIRARLMFLELTERAKGSNIKYFYNHFEEGGVDVL
jgi:hypothetical protein